MLCQSRKVCKFTINILLFYKTLCALSVYNQKVHTIVLQLYLLFRGFLFFAFSLPLKKNNLNLSSL